MLRCDTAWFPESVQLAARFEGGCWAGHLRVREPVVDLAALRSVWYRSPGTFGLPAGISAVERHWAMTEAKMGLGGVLSALPLTWVNHPARVADASVKPVQLAVAASCGLSVPDTVVTNDAEAVRRFATGRAIVAKALGAPSVVEAGGRATAFTQQLDEGDLADLRGVEVTTHQFQRWVPKAWEARVIVAGQRLFTAGIHAGTPETHVDWRNSYADLAYSRPELPNDVAEDLLRYCAWLGLSYAAVDFVITPDEEWVFLEANPGGQFGWIADAIGAPITSAIADLLTDPTDPVHPQPTPRPNFGSRAAAEVAG